MVIISNSTLFSSGWVEVESSLLFSFIESEFEYIVVGGVLNVVFVVNLVVGVLDDVISVVYLVESDKYGLNVVVSTEYSVEYGLYVVDVSVVYFVECVPVQSTKSKN